MLRRSQILFLTVGLLSISCAAQHHRPPEQIKDVIDLNRPALGSCYNQALVVNPQLRGRVVMKWQIGSDGSVSNVEVGESTLQTPAMERCLVEVFTKMQFPAPRGGAIVHAQYPFQFNAK